MLGGPQDANDITFVLSQLHPGKSFVSRTMNINLNFMFVLSR
ncbi:unnamed protein product [Arabidopsis halleri]